MNDCRYTSQYRYFRLGPIPNEIITDYQRYPKFWFDIYIAGALLEGRLIYVSVQR